MNSTTEHTAAELWNYGWETRAFDELAEIVEFLDTQHPILYCFDPPFATGAQLVKYPVAGALIARLDALQRIPETDRWPAADWPPPSAFADAIAFIESLPAESIPFPNVGLADDGEVNFLWSHDNIHVDLGFYGDGCFSYFGRRPDGQSVHGDDVPARTGLTDVLKELLCG